MEEEECKAALYFDGTMKLTVCEAADLRPTDCATRHQVGLGLGKALQSIDPYVVVDVDDVPVAKTQTRLKTFCPSWIEEFSSDVHGGHRIGLTVFHSAVIPPDVFVANCTVAFENFTEKPASDVWVYYLLVKFIDICQSCWPAVNCAFVRKTTVSVLHDVQLLLNKQQQILGGVYMH